MKKVQLDTMTGDEFKTFIEQKTDNGKVDTIPELMERTGEIPDGMSMEDFIREKARQSAVDEEVLREAVDKQLEAMTATSEDIDEIFSDCGSTPEPVPIPIDADEGGNGQQKPADFDGDGEVDDDF